MADSKKILAALKGFVAFDQDGSLDWDTTATAIHQQLLSEIEFSRKNDGLIENALDAIFDKIPADSALPTPMVVSVVAGELSGGDISAMAEFTATVTEFLDRCPRFQSKRGRNGGLFRIALKG